MEYPVQLPTIINLAMASCLLRRPLCSPQNVQLFLSLLRLVSQHAEPAVGPLPMRVWRGRQILLGEGTLPHPKACASPWMASLGRRRGVPSRIKLPPNHFEELEAAHEAPRFVRVVRDEPPHLPSRLA